MILYLTKKTFERYNVTSIENMSPSAKASYENIKQAEEGKGLLEWGGKIFYFNKRKCLQVMNLASRFTLFLFDIKAKELAHIDDLIFNYLYEFYQNDEDVTELLVRLFKEHSILIFDKLKDKSTISALNYMQAIYAEDGCRFYDYIEGRTLNTIKINFDVNDHYLVSKKIDGLSKPEYFYSGAMFKILLKLYYEKIDNKEGLYKRLDIA